MSRYLDIANETLQRIRQAGAVNLQNSQQPTQIGELPSQDKINPGNPFKYRLISCLEDLREWVEDNLKSTPDILTIDIESSGLNFGKDHICGIAINNEKETVYIAFGHEIQGGLDKEDTCHLLNPLLSRSIPKLGHNFTFDISFLQLEGFEISPPHYDTRLLAKEFHARDSSIKYGLKDLICRHIDTEGDQYDKQLSLLLKNKFRTKKKDNLWRLTPDEVCQYACADAFFTRRLFDFFKEQIRHRPESREYLTLEKHITEIAIGMSTAGIAIDAGGLNEWLKQANQRLHDINSQLDLLFEVENVNYNSAKQVLPLLNVLGFKPSNPKRGNESICLDALKGLKTDTKPVQLLMDRTRIANQIKQLSGVPIFMKGELVYPHIKVSANTGERFSATNPSLFTGKKKPEPGEVALRNFVTPHPGYSLLFFDIQASHFRILAQLCGDENMKAIFQDGKDFRQVQGADINPPQAPQNPPCGFPATGSSTLDSRIAKFLKLCIAVTDFRATNRIMLQDQIELLPANNATLASSA